MAITKKDQVRDADFTVVSGPYRVNEEHRKRRGWFFTGLYDANGDPLFYNRRFFARRRFIRRIANGYLILFAALVALLIVVSAAAVAFGW